VLLSLDVWSDITLLLRPVTILLRLTQIVSVDMGLNSFVRYLSLRVKTSVAFVGFTRGISYSKVKEYS
jgi:hypothetical protein